MILRIEVHIDAEPTDASRSSYGSLNFSEAAQFTGGDFALVSKVFTRCHELLEALKQEHSITARGPRA